MNEVRPYAVGSTVKWREGGSEQAGIFASVTEDSDLSGGDSRHGQAGTGSFEPVYQIVLSDQSVVTRSHRDLVLV